jgi:hypothetical protein
MTFPLIASYGDSLKIANNSVNSEYISPLTAPLGLPI